MAGGRRSRLSEIVRQNSECTGDAHQKARVCVLRVQRVVAADDDAEIECRADKVKDLVLRTEFLKKA